MARYLIDAYAWIEYFIGSEAGEKVKQIIENENNEIFTCAVTISEVISIIKREARDFNSSYNIILSLSKIYDADAEFCKDVGLIHAEVRRKIKNFGLADSFVLLAARRKNARIITGDLHFKNFKEAILIK